MPIIANDKLETLIRDGRARMARPGRLQAKPKEPKKEPRGLSLLQSMRDSIKGLADKDTGESTELLKRIESLLQQLITIYSMPRADPPAAVADKKKTNWKFKITRDRDGRLESIDATPEEGD